MRIAPKVLSRGGGRIGKGAIPAAARSARRSRDRGMARSPGNSEKQTFVLQKIYLWVPWHAQLESQGGRISQS